MGRSVKYIIIILIILLFVYINYNTRNIESFNVEQNPIIVIARYNENLEWLKEEPFNQFHYIVYNKGENENYYKSDKFIKQVMLEPVGRETHTYLSHIIQNYDNLNTFTIFLVGSVELENRHDRAKRLINDINDTKFEKDVFSCVSLNDTPVLEVNKDFLIDNYLSSNELNRKMNSDTKMLPADIRPYSKWYENLFGNVNADSKCFTQNSMFGITKETILSKSKSYYEKLITHVNKHHNPEAQHFFERSWETVFYSSSLSKHSY
jgi:hypothetical protein